MRPVVRKENPEMEFGAIARELGRRWKEIKKADKTKYDEMAAQDKERYEKEKQIYDEKKITRRS